MYSSLHRRNRILKIISTAKFCTLRFGFLKLTTKTPKYKKLPCGSFFYWGGRWGYAVSNSSSQRHLNSPRSLSLPLLVKMFRCFAVKKHPPGCFFILSSSEFSPISRLNTKKLPCGSFFYWGGRWGSNSRQPVPQTGALPTELRPPLTIAFY